MDISRRQAIRLGICATGTLVVMGGVSEAGTQFAQPSATADEGVWLRRDLFESCVGEYVAVLGGKQPVRMRLLRVDDVPNARATGKVGDENGFVLVLRGPCAPKLLQGTFEVECDALGAFNLFLVPGWTNASGTIYTATFNRLA